MSWLKQRPLGQKLTAIMCGLSLIPLIAMMVVGAHAVQSAIKDSITHGTEAIEHHPYDKLEVIRGIKATNLRNHFATRGRLLTSFSKIDEITEAMEKFPGYFATYTQEANNTPTFSSQKPQLKSFYEQQFAATYQEKISHETNSETNIVFNTSEGTKTLGCTAYRIAKLSQLTTRKCSTLSSLVYNNKTI